MLMELRQLEYFVAVAEDGGFTRAAARVHVAQPGVSAQVRRLERELGQDLLDRSGRAVRLTAAGAAVLPHARAALAAVAAARLAVDELRGLVRGCLAVGMVVSCSSPDLPGMLASFHRDHPAVEISLTEANSDRLIAALRDGRLDVALVGLAGAPPEGIATRVVADEPLVAAVGHGDALAARRSIPLAALRERALISLPRGTGLRTCLDDACTAAGFQPRIAFEAGDPAMLAQLAARGLGVAILPTSTAGARAELHALTITDPALRGRVEFAWRDGGALSPAARAFIRHVCGAPDTPPAGG